MKILKLLLFLFFNLSVCIVSAQTKNLNGLVSDYETGKPISNVAITISCLNIELITDASGEFQINIPENTDCELTFSSLGYKTQAYNYSPQNNNQKISLKLKKSDFELKEVVITGTGTPNKQGNSPVKTELITQKAIKQFSSGSFDDLISSLSPSFDYSPNAMGSFIQLNGLGNDYILFLIDGKRMSGNIGGQSELSRISTNNIERIEIVKGASSSLYGSDAIAGVINIITKKRGNGLWFENDSRYDSQGDYQQFNSLNIFSNKISSTTSFTHKRSDGWQLNKYELEDHRNDDPSDDELIATHNKASNKFNDYQIKQDLSFSPNSKLELYSSGTYFYK